MRFDLSKELNQATEHINKLSIHGKKIDIKVIRGNRSLKQNSYFHGIICTTFGLEFGLTIEESKEIFRGLFLRYDKKGKTFHKSTTALNTKEFEDLNEKCRKFAADQGCFIPLPNEVTDTLLNYIESQMKYL